MNNKIIPALVLALGILGAGLCLSISISKFVDRDRTVSVRGLSTRDVKADYVVWPLTLSVTSENEDEAVSKLEEQKDILKNFLVDLGFKPEDMTEENLDYDYYYTTRNKVEYKVYRTSIQIVIATEDVDRVISNQTCYSKLKQKGISISTNEWNTKYDYRGLNNLKPEMVQEATKNAREVAVKFAEDSNSKLGGIVSATQGLFSVEPDNYQKWLMHIRVVTSVEYKLK